jgi:hypothetical protein
MTIESTWARSYRKRRSVRELLIATIIVSLILLAMGIITGPDRPEDHSFKLTNAQQREIVSRWQSLPTALETGAILSAPRTPAILVGER